MKLHKTNAFIIFVLPYIVEYLLFSFIHYNLNPFYWGFDARVVFVILSIIIIISHIFTILDIYFGENAIAEIILYDEVEKMKNKNNKLRQLNELSREQLKLLRESGEIKSEAKEILKKILNIK